MPYELEKRRIGKQAEKNLLSNNLWCRKKENKKYLFSSWWSEACEFHHGNKFYFSRKWNGAFTAKNHSLAKFCRLRRLVEFSSGSESETEATYRLICADSGFCNVNRELARRMGRGKVGVADSLNRFCDATSGCRFCFTSGCNAGYSSGAGSLFHALFAGSQYPNKCLIYLLTWNKN